MSQSDLAMSMQAMELQIAQSIRDFERTTGLVVKSIKIKRDNGLIDKVKASVGSAE